MYDTLTDESIPKSYWRYRKTFLVIQALVVAALFTMALIWGFHDGKVIDFSVALYEFAMEQLTVWF